MNFRIPKKLKKRKIVCKYMIPSTSRVTPNMLNIAMKKPYFFLLKSHKLAKKKKSKKVV